MKGLILNAGDHAADIDYFFDQENADDFRESLDQVRNTSKCLLMHRNPLAIFGDRHSWTEGSSTNPNCSPSGQALGSGLMPHRLRLSIRVGFLLILGAGVIFGASWLSRSGSAKTEPSQADLVSFCTGMESDAEYIVGLDSRIIRRAGPMVLSKSFVRGAPPNEGIWRRPRRRFRNVPDAGFQGAAARTLIRDYEALKIRSKAYCRLIKSSSEKAAS